MNNSFKVVLILVYFNFTVIIVCVNTLKSAETIRPRASEHDLLRSCYEHSKILFKLLLY